VKVVNRTRQRAVQVVEVLREFAPEGVSISVGDESDISGFDLVVQSTSLGMSPRLTEDPLPDYPFTKDQVVYDIIYSPAKTRFLERAEAAGCRVINGWPMFIGQAAIQSRYFINRIPIQGKVDL
jgi:shikimate 5-dehydrogenase